METVVVVAVTGFLAFAVADMTIALHRFSTREGALADSARHALSGIEPLRTAALAASSVAPSRTILGTLYTSSPSAVVLAVPTVNSTGVTVPNSTDYVAFTLSASDPTKLIRATDAAAGSRLTTRVDTIIPLVNSFFIRYSSSTPSASDGFEFTVETINTVLGIPERTLLTTAMTLGNK